MTGGAGCLLVDGCKFDEFRCDSGACVPQTSVCDGRQDCHDASDEANCTTLDCVSMTDYLGEEYRCKGDDGPCIPTSWVCDQFADCPEADDEANCTDGRC